VDDTAETISAQDTRRADDEADATRPSELGTAEPRAARRLGGRMDEVRQTFSLVLFCGVVFCIGCSSSTPVSPSPPSTPVVSTPTPSTVTLTGRVSATNGGHPLSGLTASLGTATTTTDESGGFSLNVSPSQNIALQLTASAIVPRTLLVAAGATRAVSVDAITLSGGFDLDFYRAFVRNNHDAPGQLQPLRRWTRAPLVYVRTIDETGAPIDAVTLRTVIDAVWSVGSSWTGGQFGIADVPSGTATHQGETGWITVKWLNPVVPNICGRADVGREGGVVELNPLEGGGCPCNGSKIKPGTVRHELGHAFG